MQKVISWLQKIVLKMMFYELKSVPLLFLSIVFAYVSSSAWLPMLSTNLPGSQDKGLSSVIFGATDHVTEPPVIKNRVPRTNVTYAPSSFHTNITLQSKALRRQVAVYECGFPSRNLESFLFPDYVYKGVWTKQSSSGPNDILIFVMYGPCQKASGVFPGKILYVDNEAFTRKNNKTGPRAYEIGFLPDGYHKIRVYLAAKIVFRYKASERKLLFDPSKKPKSSKNKFLVYAQRNCVRNRDEAFRRLSLIKPVHYGGNCPSKKGTNMIKEIK